MPGDDLDPTLKGDSDEIDFQTLFENVAGENNVDIDDDVNHNSFEALVQDWDCTLDDDTPDEGEGENNPLRRRRLSASGGGAPPTTSSNTINTESSPSTKNGDEDCYHFLATELSKLGVSDREKIMFDIHGIVESSNEDPLKLNQMLLEMDRELSANYNYTEAYRSALEQNPEFVTDRKFLLQFLRCDYYNTKEAAIRVAKYFEMKKDLFGKDMLTTKITLDNIGQGGRKCVESGLATILPLPDRAGRAILNWNPPLRGSASLKDKVVCLFYLMSCIAESDQGQIRGCVVVVNNTGHNQQVQDSATSLFKMVPALPARIDCVHYVFDDQRTDTIVKESMETSDSRLKVRIKPYYGTFQENKLALMSVGIPVSVMPMEDSKEFNLSYHQEWLQERIAKESSPSSSKLQRIKQESEGPRSTPADVNNCSQQRSVTPSSPRCPSDDDHSMIGADRRASVDMFPGPLDIISGKSSVTKYHSGNIRYESVLDDYMNEYESASKMDKTKIAEKIVRVIITNNGRFIKKTEEGWVETTFLEARNKVSMAYRDRRKRRSGGHGERKPADDNDSSPTTSTGNPKEKSSVSTKRSRGL